MNTQWSRFLIWLFGSWLMISGHAFGNSYTKGMKAFRDEDYAKAYKILSAVVKKSKDKTDKAEAMVLMGAAAAKMGKKSKAESLFSKALKLDSDASIPRDVVKDKGVRKLFAKAKKGGGGGDDDMGDDFGDEKMSSKSSGSSSLTPYIPFGIGYLMDGQVAKGLLYGGAQIAGVVGFLYYNNEITKANADADAIGQDALARQAAGQAVDQETLDFLDQNEAFVKAAQSNQTLMIAVAAGGYGLSVLDGLFFGGGSSSGSKKGKRSRRRADILPPTAGDMLADSATDTAVEEIEEAPRLWNMKLHLVPRSDPGLMLSINRSF